MDGSSSGDRTSETRASFWDFFDKTFTSIRLAIFLLFALAVASILGTIIPQEIAFHQLRQAQETLFGRLALILDLHQVYRSWWFLLLLVLLCLNLGGCLRKRLPAIWADWSGKRFKETFILTLEETRPAESLKGLLTDAVSGVMHSSPRMEHMADEWRFDWTRHRIHLIGFPLIHLAIIIVLLGALIGLLFGFKGAIQIREGFTGARYTLIPSGQAAALPFEIALDKFELQHYPSGEPKEYRSEVRLIQNGQEVYRGAIRVNHPLTYGGISLFQSDYKLVGVKGVALSLEGPDGSTHELVLAPGVQTALPKGDVKIRLAALDPGSSLRGAWIDITVENGKDSPQTVRIFQKDAKPARIGDYEARFNSYQPLYASGLQIGYDPGAYIVWLGCIMLMVGFVVTLFTNYRRVRVHITRLGPYKTRVKVSGSSRRMRQEFRETLEETTKGAISST
ncbi:MAG: cytochrome c biogenesis protein ResB [Desulfomonilaceae bacterium]